MRTKIIALIFVCLGIFLILKSGIASQNIYKTGTWIVDGYTISLVNHCSEGQSSYDNDCMGTSCIANSDNSQIIKSIEIVTGQSLDEIKSTCLHELCHCSDGVINSSELKCTLNEYFTVNNYNGACDKFIEEIER